MIYFICECDQTGNAFIVVSLAKRQNGAASFYTRILMIADNLKDSLKIIEEKAVQVVNIFS